MKKIIAVLLCVMLTFSFAGTAFAAEKDGSFVLAAFTANKHLIGPVRIPYESGQTVREALLATDYEFMGLEQGFIYEINGNEAGYSLFYNGGGYDLEKKASEISVLWIGVEITYSDDMMALIQRMAEYTEMQNNVQKYPAAEKAYNQALSGIRRNQPAAPLKKALDDAIVEYEALFAGEKHTVTLTAKQGETTLTKPEFSLIDAYGNITETEGTSLQVVAGEYRFTVSDGGYNRTEGTIVVDGADALSVDLPSGEWFGEVRLLNSKKEPFRYQQNTADHSAEFRVEDTAGEIGSVYLNVGMGAVPDEEETKLRSIYMGTDGMDKSGTPRSWESLQSALTYLLTEGMDGRDFSIEAQFTDAKGHKQIQSYDMSITRIPTLSVLEASAEGTVLPLHFDPCVYEYDLVTVSDKLEIGAEGYAEGYSLSGTGTVSVSGDTLKHRVSVTAENGQTNTYTLNITKKEAVSVTLTVPDQVTVQVQNAEGSVIAPVNGVYRLVPEETYTYIATKDTYYHTKQSFTAREGLTVAVAEPVTADALTDLALYNGKSASSRIAYECSEAFRTSKHFYTYTVSDCNTSLYMQATASEYTVTAIYRTQHRTNAEQHGVEKKVTVGYAVSDTAAAENLSRAVAKSGYSQTVTVRLSRETEKGVTYYQDYILTLAREMHLSDLAVFLGEEQLNLTDSAGAANPFDRDIKEYYVQINRDMESVLLNGAFPNMTSDTPICGGYYAEVNGVKTESLEDFAVTLDTNKYQETVSVKIRHADTKHISAEYMIHVRKTDPVRIRFSVSPSDAVVYLKNNLNGKRVWDENGVYSLTPGGSYTYTVTCAGYKGVTAEYTAPQNSGTHTVALEKAPENAALDQLNAAWPSFRVDKDNNGVISAKTPVKAEDAVLYWATKIGSGYDKNACGCPIIVDGYLYTYAGTTLYKVDTVSGEIVATGELHHSSSFAINPPTYADGMIFIGLADGTVQAFNASTLESLWMYQDELKGQPNCPIVYHDGYIYTGFWVGETSNANYVCLNATDEDPTDTLESKLPTWKYTSKGGFYWAGSYVCDDYLIVGTDDGDSGYTKGKAKILSFDPRTGKLLDSMNMSVVGDIRSSVTKDNGKYYFTNKGGYFFELTVKEDGTFDKLRTLKLYNYASLDKNPPMSTCTPTIYNGRAYVGVSGTNQFGAYSGHNITVIDIKNWEIAYTVRTQGYPQTSGILTTAYEQESGCVYVYFFDNYTPGKLRVLEDSPGQTEASLVSVETHTEKGVTKTYETAYNLFEPYGEHAQYAICSPIVDDNGTIYFKNDSAYLMAVGSVVTELEITELPEKTEYSAGEVFDGTGMKVIAHYANGFSRDVTEYAEWSAEPLTANDTDFQIEFPYSMYQNADGKAGVEYIQPHITLPLTITPVIYGDADGNGEVNAMDAALVYRYVNGTASLSAEQLILVDVNGDAKVNAVDAAMIYRFVNGKLQQFPAESK